MRTKREVKAEADVRGDISGACAFQFECGGLFTVSQAGRMLGVSYDAVKQAIKRGRLTTVEWMGERHVAGRELMRYDEERRHMNRRHWVRNGGPVVIALSWEKGGVL